jgi:hypothetical protein
MPALLCIARIVFTAQPQAPAVYCKNEISLAIS